MSDLWRRNYFGDCRGRVSVSDLFCQERMSYKSVKEESDKSVK